MTIVVDLDVKQQFKQTNKQTKKKESVFVIFDVIVTFQHTLHYFVLIDQ